MEELKRIKTHGILWTILYLVILIFIIYIIFISIKGRHHSVEKYNYNTAKTETILRKILGEDILLERM